VTETDHKREHIAVWNFRNIWYA